MYVCNLNRSFTEAHLGTNDLRICSKLSCKWLTAYGHRTEKPRLDYVFKTALQVSFNPFSSVIPYPRPPWASYSKRYIWKKLIKIKDLLSSNTHFPHVSQMLLSWSLPSSATKWRWGGGSCKPCRVRGCGCGKKYPEESFGSSYNVLRDPGSHWGSSDTSIFILVPFPSETCKAALTCKLEIRIQ